MRTLIKSLCGKDCEIYAISHHRRLKIGNAEPRVEVYENSIEVPTIGTNIVRHKRTYFSVVICPNPAMDAHITDDVLRGLTVFDLSMLLPRSDEVMVPFSLYGIPSANLSADKWVFEVTDPETVRQLLTL